MAAPAAYMRAVQAHRRTLEKVLTQNSVSTMKKLYDTAQQGVISRISGLRKAGRGTTMTSLQQHVALVQLREGQALIAQRMAKQMGPLTKQAQVTSLKGLGEDISKLNKHFTGAEISLPIEEAATFGRVIANRTPSLLRMHATSMARYGANIVEKVEKKLAVGLLQGISPHEAYDDIAETVDGEWWQGERIVRTEIAYAYNVTHRDGIAESAIELPQLWQRWEEHCDASGQPLDNRVGVDSIALHGQVTPPNGMFTMPSDAPHPDDKGNTKVPPSLVGRSWDFPPNRPNDRSVLAPWMKTWGVPGWQYVGGRRVWLVR